MQKETALLILGILVFAAPLLGIPESWRAALLFALGVCLVLLAVLYRLEVRRASRSPREMMHQEYDPHVEPLTTRRV